MNCNHFLLGDTFKQKFYLLKWQEIIEGIYFLAIPNIPSSSANIDKAMTIF